MTGEFSSAAVPPRRSEMRRVPATVITGFLGAGKTSLVRHLLAHAEGHYFDWPWEAGERRETRLVVIGRKGLDRRAISAALAG
jgi:G3E family GTPase